MVPLDAGVAEAWVRADTGSRGDRAWPGGSVRPAALLENREERKGASSAIATTAGLDALECSLKVPW